MLRKNLSIVYLTILTLAMQKINSTPLSSISTLTIRGGAIIKNSLNLVVGEAATSYILEVTFSPTSATINPVPLKTVNTPEFGDWSYSGLYTVDNNQNIVRTGSKMVKFGPDPLDGNYDAFSVPKVVIKDRVFMKIQTVYGFCLETYDVLNVGGQYSFYRFDNSDETVPLEQFLVGGLIGSSFALKHGSNWVVVSVKSPGVDRMIFDVSSDFGPAPPAGGVHAKSEATGDLTEHGMLFPYDGRSLYLVVSNDHKLDNIDFVSGVLRKPSKTFSGLSGIEYYKCRKRFFSTRILQG